MAAISTKIEIPEDSPPGNVQNDHSYHCAKFHNFRKKCMIFCLAAPLYFSAEKEWKHTNVNKDSLLVQPLLLECKRFWNCESLSNMWKQNVVHSLTLIVGRLKWEFGQNRALLSKIMKLGTMVVWVILNISRGGVLRNILFCGNGSHFPKWPPL